MYVKVHKKGNRWFQNNSCIGEEIPDGPYLENLKILYGDHIIISKPDNKYEVIYHGYFDKKGHFFRFCRKKEKDCQHCVGTKKILACPKSYSDNPFKTSTGGYYIKTSD